MKSTIVKLIFTGVAALSFGSGYSQTPTWADDIAPILYAHCTSCHHQGGIGTFPLMTYSEASVPYVDLASAVQSGEMPPWKPDADYRHFKDENILTQNEINAITDWVNNGKPEGNPANAPAPPVYNPNTQLSVIDKTVQIPQYTINSSNDVYRTFVMTSGFSSDVYINQIEYQPGNPSIVHHIVFYYDPTQASFQYDNLDPGPGFGSFGVGPITSAAEWIGAWAPGQGPTILPADMGFKIPAGAYFAIEVHYAPGSQGQTDDTKINISYTSAPVIREVFTKPMLTHTDDMLDGPLFIPANTIKTFHQANNSSNTPISLIGIFPHMHRVGASYKVFNYKNNDTIPLIDIPKWDFHWQGYYTYQRLLKIEGNSTFFGEASYDNTSNNPDNPSFPPQDVSAGENTTEEMMVTFITYTDYQAGDENIILDSTLLATPVTQGMKGKLLVFPNPARTVVYLTAQDIPDLSPVKLSLSDMNGRLIKEENWNTSQKYHTISIESLPSGIYLLRAETEQGAFVHKIIKE